MKPGHKHGSGSLALYFILTALPLAFGSGYALLQSTGLAGIGAEGFTLSHWKAVWTGGEWWRSLGFSAVVAALGIGLSLGWALAAVSGGAERWRRGSLSWLVHLPLTLPALVVAFLVFHTLSGAGLISRIAYRSGLIDDMADFPGWVNDPWGIGILVAHVCMATPFFILLFTNLYHSERLYAYAQLAATMGASPRQVVRRVVIPVLLRQSFPTLVLYFLFVLGSYEIPLLLGSQSPQMISVLIIRKLQRYDLADRPQAFVMGVLYLGLVVAVVWRILRQRSGKSKWI